MKTITKATVTYFRHGKKTLSHMTSFYRATVFQIMVQQIHLWLYKLFFYSYNTLIIQNEHFERNL
jgi:hypothetical protein